VVITSHHFAFASQRYQGGRFQRHAMFYLRFILLVLLGIGFTTALLPKLYLRRSSLYKGTGLRVSPKSEIPAETTPAIDKYPSQPINGVEQIDNMRIHPIGPDPFKLVAHELEPLSTYIKAQVASENPVLTMAASHFFDKVCEGQYALVRESEYDCSCCGLCLSSNKGRSSGQQ
jgi:hypothetical protein